MPGLYPAGEYDLVGTIIGEVPRKRIVTGEQVNAGDILIGLPSTGLHTNGYSLARKVIFETAGLKIHDILPGTKRSVADILLAVHKSYLKPVSNLMDAVQIRGMAHITGGGFYDNIPRILPDGLGVDINLTAWKVPPIFSFIQEQGDVDHDEMYRVFNMGIGFIIIVRPADLDTSMANLKEQRAGAKVIGRVVEGNGVTLM
jgi:phosphoribosylformylglycinamidine cyclo-ligase